MIKLDIAPFHAGMGDTMLHDLLRRPVTLIRCSTGRVEECFYQRHGFSGLPQCGAVKFTFGSAASRIWSSRTG